MREIKFRAFDKSFKIMSKPFQGELVNAQDQIHSLTELLRRNDVWEVMQFTGLKDKTGKEIYEGDIVTSDTYNILKPVFWGYSGWEPFEYYMTLIEEDFEVIGNIYEHQYLLK